MGSDKHPITVEIVRFFHTLKLLEIYFLFIETQIPKEFHFIT